MLVVYFLNCCILQLELILYRYLWYIVYYYMKLYEYTNTI